MAYQRVSQVGITTKHSKHIITDKKAAHYFASNASTPRWVKVVMLISFALCALALIVHLYLISAFLMLPALLCLLVMYLIRKTNTTDEEYDIWLEQKEHMLRQRGYQVHGISPKYPASSVLCIRSFVPRGSITSHGYSSQEVQMKQGKDGRWRYSINVYSYFFPMRKGMAIFKSDINVFTSRHRDVRHETYPYSFLSTATTEAEEDRVIINHTPYRYQTEQLYLVFSNGVMSSFSAVVQSQRINNTDETPFSIVPNAMFNIKLNELRALLLSEGQSTQLEP